ncbi:MAG: tRNA uridine-5-carboxymethylaminomethyl(34) synthesis GTPase MnmE [Clostridia bacterium]|nr:tRNA uridine-5-carboxymethylaminomethyl(34) synthesis GTPase MnmE [Clostridia bacterium]
MSTVAAISTPPGSGGISVIRISGEDAIPVADRCFRSLSGKKLADTAGYSALYGKICDGETVIDEAVALVFRAPKSYTGEDVVEISCHGGGYAAQSVLRAILSCGADAAGPGEFTKRAFLNGKTDLAAAEAVMQVISARGKESLRAAVNTLEGALSKKIAEIKASLITLSAALSVWTDYPDDDMFDVDPAAVDSALEYAKIELNDLLSRFDSGQAVSVGVDTVICGKPNVGKSAFMNLLAGREKSIVTAVAGTTRDIIEENVLFGNVLLHLADTAGIHGTGDTVEMIGVDRAIEKMRRAALVFAVFDSSVPLDGEDMEIIHFCKDKRCIAVLNKSDKETVVTVSALSPYFDRVAVLSAKTGDGKKALEAMTEQLLGTANIDTSAPMLMNERQYRCCAAALQYITEALDANRAGMTLDAVNVGIDAAINELSVLTGEKATETVVNEIFERFCVGK